MLNNPQDIKWLKQNRCPFLTYIKSTLVCLIKDRFSSDLGPQTSLLSLCHLQHLASQTFLWPGWVLPLRSCHTHRSLGYAVQSLTMGLGNKELGSWLVSASKCKFPPTLETTFIVIGSYFSLFHHSECLLSIVFVLRNLRCEGCSGPLLPQKHSWCSLLACFGFFVFLFLL